MSTSALMDHRETIAIVMPLKHWRRGREGYYAYEWKDTVSMCMSTTTRRARLIVQGLTLERVAKRSVGISSEDAK
jgi:hypothetical protein